MGIMAECLAYDNGLVQMNKGKALECFEMTQKPKRNCVYQ